MTCWRPLFSISNAKGRIKPKIKAKKKERNVRIDRGSNPMLAKPSFRADGNSHAFHDHEYEGSNRVESDTPGGSTVVIDDDDAAHQNAFGDDRSKSEVDGVPPSEGK